MNPNIFGYNWVLPVEAPQVREVSLLAARLGLNPVVSQLLHLMGKGEEKEALRFINPSLKDLRDPVRMKGLDKCAERFARGIVEREKILIHGDYDADGITSAALLHIFLRELKAESIVYIPDRLKEGHGVSLKSLEIARNSGCTLVVTCDVGVSSTKEIAEFNRYGIDVIVTDHHDLRGALPPAFAVVDPALDTESGFSHLAGVGVAFYLLIAARKKLRESGFFDKLPEPDLREFLDLVALGTVADVSPAVFENRIFVKNGIAKISKNPRRGIGALLERQNIQAGTELSSTDIAFKIIPKINAAGRMGAGEDALNLLLAEDYSEAARLAGKLDGYNIERRAVEEKMIAEGVEVVEGTEGWQEKGAFCLASRNWHRGLLGLVAGRLVDKYCKPVAVISVSPEGDCRGSVRAFDDSIDIVSILNECAEHLESFGGHSKAGGFSLRDKKIEAFSTKFTELVCQKTKGVGGNQKKLSIALSLDIDEIGEGLLKDLSYLEPYGPQNPEPLFLVRGGVIADMYEMGQKHTKLFIKGNEKAFESVIFGYKAKKGVLKVGDRLEAAVNLELNRYNGRKNVRFIVRDARVV